MITPHEVLMTRTVPNLLDVTFCSMFKSHCAGRESTYDDWFEFRAGYSYITGLSFDNLCTAAALLGECILYVNWIRSRRVYCFVPLGMTQLDICGRRIVRDLTWSELESIPLAKYDCMFWVWAPSKPGF